MSDYLASLNEKLQKAQAQNADVLAKASAKNAELLNINKPTPNHTPVSAYNMGEIDMSSTDLQQRTDVINAKSNKERGIQEYANDAGVAGLQALHGMSESMVTLGSALVGAPVASAYNLAMGKPVQSTGQFIDSTLTKLGYRDTAATLKAWESPQLQEIRKEGYAIDNNPNMTESEKYKAKVKYWASNPATTLTDSASVLARSLGETYLFGGMGGKILGLESQVGKVSLGAGASGFTGYTSDVLNDPRNTNKELSIPNALMAGAGTALIGGAFAKFSPLDFDKAFVGGGTGVLPRVPSSTLIRTAGGGANEALEETLQGSALQVLKEYELTGELSNRGLGSAAADSTVLGFGSGGLMGTMVGAPQDAQTINNNVVDVLAANAEKKRVKREGTTEEQLDMTSPKSNPTKVFKQALYDLKSDDAEVREFSANLIARSTNVVTAHKEALEEDISKATTDEEKEAAIQALNDFRTKSYDPLQAEIKLYINSKGSKKNLLSSANEIVARQRAAAEKVLLDRESKTERVNVNELAQQLGSSTNTANTVGNIKSSNVPEAGKKYQTLIETKASKHGVSSALINAIVHTESAFKPDATSPKGASGLMQLMPDTAKGLGISNSKDPEQNLEGGVRYIKEELGRYNGDLDKALMAYNWGRGNLDKYLKAKAAGKNVSIPTETQNYVIAVKKRMGRYSEGSTTTSTVPSNSRGDTRYTNKEAYDGLKIKSSESYGGKGGAIGHTIDFAHVIQNTLGESLERFTGFDDTYNRKTKNHSGGKGVDFTIKDGLNLSVSNKIEADLYAQAKAQGYEIKVLNEYDPKKRSAGSAPHMHITVVGRNGDVPTNAPVVGSNQEDTKASNQVIEDNSDTEALQKMLADLDEEEKAEVTANDPTLEEDKKRLARIAAAKGDIDSNIAKVLYSTEQVEALRKVDKLKAELASKNNLSDTQNEIVNGKKSKSNNPLESTLGLKDYDDIFAAALATNDTKTVNLNLAYLERFNENHQSKNELIQKILSKPIPEGGVQIAANASGKWIEVSDKQLKDLEAFKGSKPLIITKDNNLTRSINEEAGWISERLSSWSNLTSKLMEGITPIKLATSNPLATSFSNATSTPVATTPVSTTPPPTATVSQSFTPVNNISEVKSDGFYLGRGKDSNGETISISSLDPNLKGGEMNVGKPGWLGDGGTQTKTIDDYIGKFKTYAKEYDSFVPQLIEDLSKPLYAYKKPKAESETNFLLSLASEIKGKSKEEVAGIIGRIESYSYKDGLKLSAPTSVTPTETQGLPDRKVRSSIDAKGTKLGVAPDAMKPTKAPNELNNKSAVGKNEYTNQYTHTEKRNDGKEELWQVLINRNATTNKIEDISVIQGDRDVEVFEAPNASWSDEATIDWLQKEGYELAGNYKQAAYSNESIDLPKMEMDYIDKVSIPKEVKNKTIKVSDMIEKYKGAIDSKNIEEKEVALYTAIIEPLLNFNPDLKVRISSDLGDNRYDSKTNTIHINPKNKGHILSETARLVIENSTKDLAKKLEDSSYDKLDAKNEDLVKLNNELSYIRQIINRNGLLENDSKLSIPLRKKLLEALSSNSKLLSMSLTDSEIMKHLQGISYNLDDKKPNNSVFNKIVSAVRTFFNIGNNNEVANLFDKMVELTARTAQIQAMNKDVSFKPSEEGKAHIFQNLIEADSILEMEKSYYSRNNLLAKFKQVTAKSKPLSGIANLASKLKMDLMQGVNALTKISPNRAQREQLEDFLQFRDEFSIHLMDTFAQKKVTYKVEGVKKAMSLEEFTKYEEDNGKVATDKLTVNDFSSQDLKSNLMDADGNIDENTLTAAAIAAYDFFIEYGNRTTNRDKDIRKLLNLDDDSTNYIPSNVQEDYVDGVMLKNVQGHSLGKKVTDLMNIKSNGLGSIEVASELDSSIGEWLVSAMQSADLIHIRSMPTKDHYSNIAEVGGELTDDQKKVIEDGSKGEITFISVVDKNSKNRNPRIQEIVDASKGTLGYMGNVFGSEVGLVAPTLLPTDEMIKIIRGTGAVTAQSQLDMMHTIQQAPMRVNSKAYDAMMTVLDKHRSETLLMMKADVTEEQLAAEHVSDRHRVKSSAEGLLRELSTMTDFVGTLKKDSTGKHEAFYDSNYGAKNSRMHYASNMVNFQLSKIHRAMVDYENFEADVDITGLDTQNWYNEDGTTSELGFVLRGIMEQAEGTEELMKTALDGSAFTQGFTVDKLPSEAVLDHFYKYVTTDEQVTKAVASMDKLLNQSNKFTSEDMSNISELVEFWEGDLGSFRVLMELTNLLNAQKNGDKTLTTSIGVGSDGVNNGIAISTIQMGVASDRFLAQVGIIPEGEEYAQVNGYYDTRKIKDLGDYYEGFKSIILSHLGSVSPAIIALNTSLDSRTFMKAILIPFGYSAGDKRLHQVAFSQMLEDIKGSMRKIAAMDETLPKTQAKLKELEDNLSTAIGSKVELPKGKAILEYWFTAQELSGLKSAHEDGLAEVIDKSIKEYAGKFIQERNRNVRIQNASSEAYLKVRKAIVAKANQAYKESLKNSDTYKGMTDAQLDKLISLEGMPKQFYMENVENILKDVRPSVRTPFNVGSYDSSSDFNAMQDTKTLKANEGSVASNKRVSDGNLYSTNTELAVIRMLEESVGITVSSAQVQGVDAFIAAWASAKADAVNRNIHDQGDSGVRNFVSMGKAQNQATFEALKIYHVQLESLASLGRTLDAINSMVSEGVIDSSTYEDAVAIAVETMYAEKYIAGAIKWAIKEGTISEEYTKHDLITKVYPTVLMGTVEDVRSAEFAKLGILKRMRVVQQYAGENGEYIPTQADRDSVDLEKDKIDNKLFQVKVTINSIGNIEESVSTEEEEDTTDVILTKAKASTPDWALAKDQDKSDEASKFVGFGSEGSSTNQYRIDWGSRANSGNYESKDIVFVSSNGKGKGRINVLAKNSPYRAELKKVVDAGATIIMDNAKTRSSDYNIGEQEAMKLLQELGYGERTFGSGVWSAKTNDTGTPPPSKKPTREEVTSPTAEQINEATTVYDKLPKGNHLNGNVVVKSTVSGSLFSLRKKVGNKHFGNPFSSVKSLVERDNLIPTKSTKESVVRYIDWVLNSQDERAVWVRNELSSGKYKGKPIIYYNAKLNEPSHANALDYLVNIHTWNTVEETTIEPAELVSEKDTNEKKESKSVSKVEEDKIDSEITNPYELSNVGDRRFSDTSATMGEGKNLRQLYNQEVRNRKLTKSEDKYQLYKRLWKQYLMVYGSGYEILKQLKADGFQFTDNFAKDGISAARAVNELIDEGIGDYTNITDVGAYIKELMDNSAKEGTPISDIQKNLYQYIYRAYKDVNPNMTFSLNNEKGIENRHGVHFGDINHVTVFTKSATSSEGTLQVLMHEMAHGITVNKIKNTTDPVVIAAHNELENMRLELLSKVTDPFIRDYVLENVYELIAYGLTDGVFAKFIADNLSETYNVPVNNKGEAYGLKYGLRLFLDKVKQFFYGDKVTKGAANFEKFISLIDLTVVKLTENEIKKSRNINVPLGNFATMSPLDTLKNMSNGNATPEHVNHLDSIISSTVSDTLSRDPSTVTDIIDSVSKKALSAGFKLSDKELYTMEIVKATINEYLNTSSGAKTVSELRKVFARVTDKLTYESFLTDPTNATQSQIAIAKRKYQYVKFPRGTDKDTHVERVIALLVTSEEFRQVADKVTNKSLSEREGTWFNSLMAYLENIFNAMTGKVLGIDNLSNSKQADQLLKRIQIIHNNGLNHQKHKLDIMYEESLKVLTNPLNWTTNKIVDGIFKGIEYSGSKFSQDSTVGSILRATTKVRKTGINEFGETIIRESALLNENPSNRLNAVGEVFNELVVTKGMKATVEEQLRATKKLGQDRDTIKKSTIKILAKAFSRELSSVESNSITQQLLRPDMSSLLFNGYNVTRVMKLLRNQKERNKEVAKLETKILDNPNGNDILIQTKSLALYMAKEESVEHVVKNAENVAIGKDSWYEVPMESMDVDLRNDIDVLASLYAYDFTDNSSRKTFLELMASEEEGVKAILQTHKEMIKLAKEEFKDNPYSYIKGFTPQLTNPLKSLMFAETAEDIKALENEGWVKVSDGDLKQDPTDTSSPRTLMYHNDMLYQDYISGALDMKDTHAKGTNVYDLTTLKDLKRVEQAKRNKRRSRDTSMSYMNYDPRKVKGNSLIANYNSEGSVINYSYEMSGEVRDSYLERNNNAFEMVGILNSDAHFKPAVAESQRNVAGILFTDYEDNYLSDPRQYIVLDPNSPDPDVVMKWKMMPYAFKAEAANLFGKGNPIVVRTNVYNAVFGFRAYSLSEIFDPKHKKESVQGIVATVLTAVMGEKAKMRVIQAERLYQAGIDKMKNFIVIRNHAVLVGNVIANSLLLTLHGVAPVQQAKDMISVWRNGGNYRKAATRIAEIDVELSINQSRPKVVSSLKRERNILNKALEQNPMHMFMKAGLMSTIVEDVGMNTEDTGFKSDLDKKVDEVVEYIPEQIRTAFSWAIMSPGTPLHEFMKHATQFSDLAAKYSLATQRMREGASMKKAITEAQDNFINYDVPTGRGIDYMNRMGLWMFTKFFIRFQQVLLNRLHFKAGSTIGQHVAMEQLGYSGILDPLAVTRIGNVPFQAGIMGYDEAFKNISTVSLIPGM